MILLDTHIWLWWLDQNDKLKDWQLKLIEKHQKEGIGISIFSCWEVAKLVELKRIVFECSIDEWMTIALMYPGIQLIDLTPHIVIESTRLPGKFHKDPADQLIVATARIHNISLLTSDEKILDYPHVKVCDKEDLKV